MPFPRKLLIENEQLVLELRPHWIALVMPAIVTILVIAGWIAGGRPTAPMTAPGATSRSGARPRSRSSS